MTLLSILLATGEQPDYRELQIRTALGHGHVYRGKWDIRLIDPKFLERKAAIIYSDIFWTVIVIEGDEGGLIT